MSESYYPKHAQPTPKPGKRSVFEFALNVLNSRRLQGVATYGTELQTHNGRDALWDAIEESADLLVYLVQEWMEREDAKRDVDGK